MQNTLLHTDNISNASRQAPRQNLELLDTLTSLSKGIFSEKKKKSSELLENLGQPTKSKGQFSYLKNGTIEDWKAEFDKHPEWQGLSIQKILKRKDGAITFYHSFYAWRNDQLKNIIDKRERKIEQNKLKNMIFQGRSHGENFSDLMGGTIEDWKAEFDKHPEWQGLNTNTIKKTKEGSEFYISFTEWRNNQVKNITDKKEKHTELERLKDMILQSRGIFSYLKDGTAEDWKLEFDRHPEWQGLSTKKIQQRKEDGGLAFYTEFRKRRRNKVRNITNKKERNIELERLKEVIFQSRGIFCHLKDGTVEDWKVEFDKHPEWKGLSTKEMQERKEDGALAFYSEFRKWRKRHISDIKNYTQREEEDKKLAMVVFPEIKTPLYYTFNNNKVAFDSAAERKCAMILYNLGLVPTFIEGQNLHVRSNGKALNSLDFKIGSIFLEYHPAQRRKTFTEGSQKKYKHITNLHHKDQTELYVFDDIYELYDIIKENRTLIHYVPIEKLHYLTHPDEFQRLVDQINKELVDYDTQNTKITNIQSSNNFISDNLTGAEINSKAA